MSKDSRVRHNMGTLLTFTPTGEYYFEKALKAYQCRDFHKAKKYLKRAMQLDPSEPLIPFQLAVICAEMGEYQESNRLLHTILEEWDETKAECHYFLANNYAHLGLFKDAYHHANLYLELDGDGEFAEDTEDLIDLLTLESEDMEDCLYEQDDLIVKQEEARELLEAGQFPQVVQLLNSLIAEFPEYWSAYNNLALAYFYLGEGKKADDTLNEVLEKNPGNLHALCNKLVFAYYNQDLDKVKALKEALIKIKPLMVEHQFKLGATFALIGEYVAAFALLKRLQNQGFDGYEPYYYWFSQAAFFTGREAFSRKIWKKVIELNPEKEGLEPWNRNKVSLEGLEEKLTVITKNIHSEQIEERLFGLFLTSLSDKKDEILSSYEANSRLEEQYIQVIRQNYSGNDTVIAQAHETAKQLYYFHHPIGDMETGLYLMWFSCLVQMEQDHLSFKNDKACAAAVEYVWRKLRHEKYSQKYIAKQYDLSLSTIQKYVKIVNKYLS